MMNGNGWGGSMWGAGGMWLWWVLIVAGVIAFAVWMVRTYGQAPPPGGSSRIHTDSAEEILRERYARGEIDKDEFDRRMNDLRRSGGMASGGAV